MKSNVNIMNMKPFNEKSASLLNFDDDALTFASENSHKSTRTTQTQVTNFIRERIAFFAANMHFLEGRPDARASRGRTLKRGGTAISSATVARRFGAP